METIRDLAKLYQCRNGTKLINLDVKRNQERFPKNYCFQLTQEEYDALRRKNFTLKSGSGEIENIYLMYLLNKELLFHDRYFILDKDTIYHCGTSLNHLGTKTFSINLLEDEVVKISLLHKINSLSPTKKKENVKIDTF